MVQGRGHPCDLLPIGTFAIVQQVEVRRGAERRPIAEELAGERRQVQAWAVGEQSDCGRWMQAGAMRSAEVFQIAAVTLHRSGAMRTMVG